MIGKFDVPRFGAIDECAKLTGLAKYRIRQLIRQNKVKYILAGRKFLVNINSLIAYLNRGDNPTKCERNNNDIVVRKVSV